VRPLARSCISATHSASSLSIGSVPSVVSSLSLPPGAAAAATGGNNGGSGTGAALLADSAPDEGGASSRA